jgi:hypothetical protein
MRLQFLVIAMQYQKWDQPAGKTVAIAKNFMQENFYDGSYEAFSKASYQKSYTYAKAQGATTESLDHYRARHELAWLKIRTQERKFLELQATPAVTPDALISAFDVVLHAIFYAAQESD